MHTNVYSVWPDNQESKEVRLQAALTQLGYKAKNGEERHVSIMWTNGMNRGDPIIQVVQLGGQSGIYRYILPLAKMHDARSLHDNNTFFTLGTFTRNQRERILDLAEEVKFEGTSVTNGCGAWMRDLLVVMVQEGLISQEIFHEMDVSVPLQQRKAEA